MKIYPLSLTISTMPPNQPFQPYPEQPPLPPKPKQHHAWNLIVPLVVSVVFLLAALVFGMWAFSSRADYKNNSDKKAADAVAIAVQRESSRKDKEFVEKEKLPLKKYLGPPDFGTLEISYPKTWSAFVTELDKGSTPVDGYFHPNFVPGLQSGTAFALRVQVTSQAYDQELKQFESKGKTGKVKITAYSPKNVPGVTGARVDGEISTGQQGTMILLPLRDKTIKISSETQQFIGDFNSIILENLKFVP